MDDLLAPPAPYVGPDEPVLRHAWEPPGEPPRTEEQVALEALETRLADVRRLLIHAGHVRCRFAGDVKALGSLAEQLHHQVAAAAQ